MISGGTVVDGTGAPARTADVAVTGGRVTHVGRVDGPARRMFDATGCLVAPGWVDIHTHFDGQATWDPLLTPSSWHGVTTVVMGNCGVGFAPMRPGSEAWLAGLMEGVEDIPSEVLTSGMPWGWETFGDYLDVLDRMPHAIDMGALLPHGALRAYVMGERGARNDRAGDDDLHAMDEIAREAFSAGALGVSTSRTTVHKAVDGEPVPGTFADDRELDMLARAVADHPGAIFQIVPRGITGEDPQGLQREMDWITRVGVDLGCPTTVEVQQSHGDPDAWQAALAACEAAHARGAFTRPQVAGRLIAILFGHQTALHPFARLPSYLPLARLPLDERVARLRDPDLRRRLLAEEPPDDRETQLLPFTPDKIFPIGDPPDYEPEPEQSVAALAQHEQRSVKDVLYDRMLDGDGRELLMYAGANYAYGDGEAVRAMLEHPLTLLGASDAGAHVGVVCDASMPTFMLTHWARDRRRGPRLALEQVVHDQTLDTARAFGLHDRGVLAAGYRADINIIDFEGLQLRRPEMLFDLPGGFRRLVQRADGYVATIVHGEVITEHGEDTGARPGHVVRRPTLRR
ncbi:MAG: amidohydrolase family protein [Acidimicrobiia bacterium]